jgi:sugar lactone lactonase YvrE
VENDRRRIDVVGDEHRADGRAMLLMRGSNAGSLVSVFLALCLASCGGSASTPTPSHASAQNGWQLILTVNTVAVNFGIPGIVLDGHGNLYLAELDDNLIYKYSLTGKELAHWGGHGSGPGQLIHPDKLALDTEGNLYVTEIGGGPTFGTDANNRIQKFSAKGESLARWGSYGSAPGQFSNPIGIAVDQQGDIYVSEEAGNRVQKLSSTGQPLAQWGTLGSGPGQFNVPYDLALDTSGNVYVSEPAPFAPGNHRIQKFSPTGVPLAQWGGPGDGPGQFSDPTGLALDSKGNIFVVDKGNNRIQELSPTGQFVAQWKGPGLVFTSKVALDGHGSIYVSAGSQVFRRSS